MLRALLIAAAIAVAAIAVSPPASAAPPYRSCDEAHADGRYDIPKGDAAYSPGLDGDTDGIACES
jgi:hypothetical protein